MMDVPIRSLHEQAMEEARERWRRVAKPLDSLGKLEKMIVQLAGVQETAQVALSPRCALVFCADHGVVEEGISQSGQEVTALVAKSIADGCANINLMSPGTDVFAVDMGMRDSFAHPRLLSFSLGKGTKNMANGPAMSREEARQALQMGMDLAGEMKHRGYRLIATGEMGIGNTTASAALACALLRLSPGEAAGRGAGLSDQAFQKKKEVIARAIAQEMDEKDPVDVLSKVGGFEIAAMAGAFLGGMVHGVPVVIDGVISAVAALIACRICPQARDFMLPSHLSREPAALRIFEELQLSPMLDADLALGEGTGAVLLFPLLQAALNVYLGDHTFESLNMEAYTRKNG